MSAFEPRMNPVLGGINFDPTQLGIARKKIREQKIQRTNLHYHRIVGIDWRGAGRSRFADGSVEVDIVTSVTPDDLYTPKETFDVVENLANDLQFDSNCQVGFNIPGVDILAGGYGIIIVITTLKFKDLGPLDEEFGAEISKLEQLAITELERRGVLKV